MAAGVLLYVNELAPVRGDLVELKSAMSAARTLQLQPTGLSKDAEIAKTHKWPKKLPSRIPAKPLAAGEEQHAVLPRTLPGTSLSL